MSEATDLMKMITTKPATIDIYGEQVEIRALRVKQIPEILVIAAPYYDKLTALLKESKDFRAKVEKAVKDGTEVPTDAPFDLSNLDFYNLVSGNINNVVQLIALLSGRSKEWVEELELDHVVMLFLAIVEVNTDFFIKRLLPLLSEVMAEVIQPAVLAYLAKLNGQMPSSPSSEQDTDTTTS